MNDIPQNEIKDYWYMVLRRKYVFISTSLIVLSIIVWGSFFIPEKYEANSTVFIEQSAVKKLIQGNRNRSNEGDSLRGLKQTMLSRTVLLAVIRALDLDAIDNYESGEAGDVELEIVIERLAENTSIKESPKEDIFTVSYVGRHPSMVKEYVNTLVEKYIETILSIKKDDAYGASRFISDQIDYYKSKLAAIEEGLADFRRKEGIYLAIDARTLVNSMKDYGNKIEDVEMEIKKLEAKKKRIEQQLSKEPPFTLAIMDNDGEHSLLARLKLLEQKLQILLTNYTENYPDVIKTKVEIEAVKRQFNITSKLANDENLYENVNTGISMMNPIYQQLKEELLRTETEIDSLKANQESLGNRIKRTENELKSMPKSKKILSNLERDRDTYQSLYEQMLARLGEAEVNEQVEAQNKGETYKIIERAIFPRKPVSPDRIKLILLGILAGIAAGFAIVLLIEKNDSSIRDVDILKSQLKVKMLGVIPSIVTEKEIRRKHNLDKGVYTFSIFYLVVIAGVFVKELIERFASN